MNGGDAQAAGLDRLAGLDRPVHVEQPRRLERVGQDLDPVALLPDVVLGHVVGVVVGEQEQLHVEPEPLRRLEQRLRGPPESITTPVPPSSSATR